MATKTAKTAKKEVKSPTSEFVPDVMALLEAGAHFGHERSKRNPKMEKYIFMHRNRVAIFDLEQTVPQLQKALDFIYGIAKVPGNEVLFVGTKRQARSIIRKHAEEIGQPYVTKRWLGGTLTNFATIQKSIEKLDELKKNEGTPAFEKITKKERAVHKKEIERLEEVLEGIKTLRRLPALVVAVGAHDERLAVKEAKRMGIPVVGIADTNADPSQVTHAIPANDDAIRSIEAIMTAISKTITKAKKSSQDIPKLVQ